MRAWSLSVYLVLGSLSWQVSTLDNGLALTPPMGWLTWQRFRCITNCDKYPRECISEDLIMRTVDAIVEQGYRDAGYDYVGIDDCWLEMQRGEDGRMVPDKKRFPSGMKALADYIHDNDLKFGMYQDYGTHTCAGYPGVLGHEQIDVDTFLEWEIDYLKLDGCYIDIEEMDTGYPAFGKLLNATGRQILYSCSWPAYQEWSSMKPDYEAIAKHCNLWRNYGDIDDSWYSVIAIMDWFGDNQDRLAKHAGPGHWNDPDMLVIGNFGLSVDQSRVQMAVWAVLAAPLLISADLHTMRPEFREILLNKKVIAVNQDPMGKQGLRIIQDKTRRFEVWSRELSDGSNAIAFVSRRTDGAPYTVFFSLRDLGLDMDALYVAQDLYDDVDDIEVDLQRPFEVRINPTGVKFYKFVRSGGAGRGAVFWTRKSAEDITRLNLELRAEE